MKKVFIYISSIIILLVAAREAIYIGLRKNKTGVFQKYNTLFLEKNNFETIVVGSSRALSGYHPLIIDTALKTNSFNIGVEGAFLRFQMELFGAYLENSQFPKNIILNVDYHTMKCDNDTIHDFARFFPYLKNKKLYAAVCKRDKRFPYFYYLPFYSLPFTGDKLLAASLRGYMNAPSDYDQSYYKGFIPYFKKDVWDVPSFYGCNDGTLYNNIDTLAMLCKKNNAKLYIVLPPIYCKAIHQVINRDELLTIIKQKAENNKTVFLDYSMDAIGNDSTLFVDPYHMNEKGAKEFTLKLVRDIKAGFNK